MKNELVYLICLLLLLLGDSAHGQQAQKSRYIPKSDTDTPTQPEIAVYDASYITLQKEIEDKICDNDWEITPRQYDGSINKGRFFILRDHLPKDVVLRGSEVHRFMPISYAEDVYCTVVLKAKSPLNAAIDDSIQKEELLFGRALASGDGSGLDSISLKEDHLRTEKEYGTIQLELNEDWVAVKATYPDSVLPMPHVDGVANALLFEHKVEEKGVNPDILYDVRICIGNWSTRPDANGSVTFHFVHMDSQPWIDKQHSGKPVIENMVVNISGENYERVMKIVRTINWTKLSALVSR